VIITPPGMTGGRESDGHMRRGETTGRPIADEGFPASIGRLRGRDLTPPQRGRRPKQLTLTSERR